FATASVTQFLRRTPGRALQSASRTARGNDAERVEAEAAHPETTQARPGRPRLQAIRSEALRSDGHAARRQSLRRRRRRERRRVRLARRRSLAQNDHSTPTRNSFFGIGVVGVANAGSLVESASSVTVTASAAAGCFRSGSASGEGLAAG